MCGRYSLTTPGDHLVEVFGVPPRDVRLPRTVQHRPLAGCAGRRLRHARYQAGIATLGPRARLGRPSRHRFANDQRQSRELA